MNYSVIIKTFLIFAGIWNFWDGIVSIKIKSLKHSWITDSCRAVRALLGIGLIIIGVYL